MDVVTAFLHGNIEEDVFMGWPPRFEQKDSAKTVYKLSKVLYALNQTPKHWYSKIDCFLLTNVLGKERNSADDCMYIGTKGKE